MSHPEAKGECSQPGHEVGDQSEISVSKRMEVIGLSPWTSEMDMTLAMNFRVDIGDPRRRGVVTGRQAPCGHKKSHKLMAQNHTPSPPPSIPFSKGQVWASCSFRRLQGRIHFLVFPSSRSCHVPWPLAFSCQKLHLSNLRFHCQSSFYDFSLCHL